MRKGNKLVFGIGVNDADYVINPSINGGRVICPFYQVWHSMLARCYSEKYQAKNPTYTGCSVDPEWHSFIAFRAWMAAQDWQGRELDKDLLIPGNKVYGPQTCVFISSGLNNFTVDRGASRGECPIGVSWQPQRGKFLARCCNPFSGKQENIGYFACADEAHEAWRKRKHELANQIADLQEDERLAKALRERYAHND